MKKLGQRFKIGIFMGILILPSLLWMGMKLVAPDSYRKLNYDLGRIGQGSRSRMFFL